jgi:cold shock CspA family protein
VPRLKKLITLLFIFTSVPFLWAQTLEDCDKIILEGVQEMSNKNHAKSIELLSQAKSMANANHWPKQEFLAINNIGVNYYLLLDYGEALNQYLEAYKIALKDLEPNQEMIVLNNIAILYSKEKKFTKAEEYFFKAYEIAEELNDSIKVGLYGVNLASVAIETEDLEKAEKYVQIALPRLTRVPNIFKTAQVIEARTLYLKKEYGKAKTNILALLPELDKPELSEHLNSAWMLLSLIYEKEGDMDSAIRYAKMVGSSQYANIENKIDSYDRLTNLYRTKNEVDVAFLYKDSILAAKDSMNQIKNGQLFENSQIKFELQKFQNDLSESKKKLATERRTFYTILGITLLLIFMSLWAFRNYSIKLKQRKIIAEGNQKIMELELEKEKNLKELWEQKFQESEEHSLEEKQQLKIEIENKNRQLAAKALSVSTRNELIEDIINSISAESIISRNKELKTRILELKVHLKKDNGKDDFFAHFEEINNGFLSNLQKKHPELNPNDIRFLSYVFMNLTTKEIASLLNITFEACRKRKTRIIHKMNLPENINIYTYLSSI